MLSPRSSTPSQAQGPSLLGDTPEAHLPSQEAGWLLPASPLTMAAGPCRSGREGASRQALEVEWQGQSAQQAAPRFSPWQGSLVMSCGRHRLQCQQQAWPGAGRKRASDGQPGWGYLEPGLSLLSSRARGLGPAHFIFCLVLPSRDRTPGPGKESRNPRWGGGFFQACCEEGLVQSSGSEAQGIPFLCGGR